MSRRAWPSGWRALTRRASRRWSRRIEPRAFREEAARERLLRAFGVASLEAFGCEHLPLAMRAAGAVVAYLRETQRDARGADHRAGDLQRRAAT